MPKINSYTKEEVLPPHSKTNHLQLKNDFIKFNVSPEFKALAVEAAQKYGMSVSELGRVLFAAFITGISHPSLKSSDNFLSHLKRNHRFNSVQDALDCLSLPAED